MSPIDIHRAAGILILALAGVLSAAIALTGPLENKNGAPDGEASFARFLGICLVAFMTYLGFTLLGTP